ncbi:hypothetical protein GCM10009601_37170 [Streptomyces thermospinosisporus]|uniref:Uncharacterized protein n=1 Tax=Streptomyces thermospinosisporus TaxID=161482 RepID=A0ABP4JSA1_9ACTN
MDRDCSGRSPKNGVTGGSYRCSLPTPFVYDRTPPASFLVVSFLIGWAQALRSTPCPDGSSHG